MEQIASRFALAGQITEVTPVSSGHINSTWQVATDAGKRYILQRINHQVFRDVPGLMRNIERVTTHLRAQTDDPRAVLTLVPALQGGTWVEENGAYYRVYDYIAGSVCLLRAENAGAMRASGTAFGRFQRQLADFPAAELTEGIPHFHDTPERFRQLHEAIEADRAGRLGEVGAEVDFALERERDAGAMVAMQREGALPTRVTHNDTKLSNVLLDEETLQPLCVIDLDTIMPGLAGNDFGDAIRFGASTALEDEPDLEKVHFSMPFYRAFAEGFLGECGAALTDAELDTLPLGARLMTLECGIRFLTDYLNGDTYYHVDHPTHNLERTRTQFRLLAEMEAQEAGMRAVIRELAGR